MASSVPRRRGWAADHLGWVSTFDAKYVALTLLQADVLLTTDPELARRVGCVVETATVDLLT
jgi:predicted nucleic acid-binding protein